MSKRNEKKDANTSSNRRLQLRRELVRNLTVDDLKQIQGGVGCTITMTTGRDC